MCRQAFTCLPRSMCSSLPPLTLGLGYRPTEVCEESILFRWDGWGTEGDTRAPPELICMFPQSGAAEAPNDQVMIRVVHGVKYGYVPKDTTVRLQDEVRLVPRLPHQPTMLHIRFSWFQGHRYIWESSHISSSPAAARSSTIYSSCSATSGPMRSALKLLATSSSDQRECFPTATRKHSMVEASSGKM